MQDIDPPKELIERQSKIIQHPGVFSTDLSRLTGDWIVRVFGTIEKAEQLKIEAELQPYKVSFIDQDEPPKAYST